MKIMFNKYSVFIVSILLLAVIMIKPLDRSSLEESEYYIKTLEKFNLLDENIDAGDTIKVGWGKESLVPPFTMPMAGYGARDGEHFDGVNDSVWVRAVVFDNGKTRSAYLSKIGRAHV